MLQWLWWRINYVYVKARSVARLKGRPEEGGGITSTGRYTSAYYEKQVVLKHPERICDEWIERVVAQPECMATNPKMAPSPIGDISRSLANLFEWYSAREMEPS